MANMYDENLPDEFETPDGKKFKVAGTATIDGKVRNVYEQA